MSLLVRIFLFDSLSEVLSGIITLDASHSLRRNDILSLDVAVRSLPKTKVLNPLAQGTILRLTLVVCDPDNIAPHSYRLCLFFDGEGTLDIDLDVEIIFLVKGEHLSTWRHTIC
jgi:hypothetical protein